MIGRRALACCAAVLVLSCICGCGRAPRERGRESGRLRVFVSILPQQYLAERIGGDRVSVAVLCGPGQNPHVFEPTPRQMELLAQSSVYLCIGVPLERPLVKRIASIQPKLRIVNTIEGVTLIPMVAEDHEEHEAGGTRDHVHEAGEMDPHVWLDPRRAAIIARNTADALKAADPAGAEVYEKNLQTLLADLAAADREIAQALAPFKGAKFMVYHPAFGYFADAYGLEQVPVEIEGKEPSSKRLAEIIRQAREMKVRIIFVQPQFSRKSAEAVAQAIDGVVAPLDDLAKDYLDNLRWMARQIEAALQRPAPANP